MCSKHSLVIISLLVIQFLFRAIESIPLVTSYNESLGYIGFIASRSAHVWGPRKGGELTDVQLFLDTYLKPGMAKIESHVEAIHERDFDDKVIGHAFTIDELELIVVAFRGTATYPQYSDQFESIGKHDMMTINDNYKDVKVLSYDGEAFQLLWPQLGEDVKKLLKRHPTYTVFFAGQSLGGALAAVAAANYAMEKSSGYEKAILYTYGEPRTGNYHFADTINENYGNRSYRILRQLDPVPHGPPCDTGKMLDLLGKCIKTEDGFYHHNNEVWYNNTAATPGTKPVYCETAESRDCSNGAHEMDCARIPGLCHMWHVAVYGGEDFPLHNSKGNWCCEDYCHLWRNAVFGKEYELGPEYDCDAYKNQEQI